VIVALSLSLLILHDSLIRVWVASLAFCTIAAGHAQGAVVFTTQAPSHVTIEGSSNLSSWHCRSHDIEARLEVEATLDQINARIDRMAAGDAVTTHDHPLPRFRLSVPVNQLRCGNRLMDRDMQRSLNAREHPAITFDLRTIAGVIAHEALGDRYRTAVTGEIGVAGYRRRVTIDVDGWRLAPDAFYLRARVPLKMTDFGVRPPTALFGLIRTRDEITALFELRIQARPLAAQ
jgi:hypothetical protein